MGVIPDDKGERPAREFVGRKRDILLALRIKKLPDTLNGLIIARGSQGQSEAQRVRRRGGIHGYESNAQCLAASRGFNLRGQPTEAQLTLREC